MGGITQLQNYKTDQTPLTVVHRLALCLRG